MRRLTRPVALQADAGTVDEQVAPVLGEQVLERLDALVEDPLACRLQRGGRRLQRRRPLERGGDRSPARPAPPRRPRGRRRASVEDGPALGGRRRPPPRSAPAASASVDRRLGLGSGAGGGVARAPARWRAGCGAGGPRRRAATGSASSSAASSASRAASSASWLARATSTSAASSGRRQTGHVPVGALELGEPGPDRLHPPGDLGPPPAEGVERLDRGRLGRFELGGHGGAGHRPAQQRSSPPSTSVDHAPRSGRMPPSTGRSGPAHLAGGPRRGQLALGLARSASAASVSSAALASTSASAASLLVGHGRDLPGRVDRLLGRLRQQPGLLERGDEAVDAEHPAQVLAKVEALASR